eukprot:gnl/TRDRNA2_/TRDRNA2_188340_c0_seq1.p1 gnl/TRDRNA2_/TRDRNA2_188340_c0~~gnl/TRDRNA2_/TRDRNA2_188340_c0_seq1.p1  ORF type:complete len:634 (-),score=103.91 gnl/TRDRNA2_/TRDRNA2_188340_c0_seq1:143-2014(-)
MADFAEAAATLCRDGFAVARSCVDGAALRALVEEYEWRCLPGKHTSDVRRESFGPTGSDGHARVVHVSNVYELPQLAQLAAEPRLVALASACLGANPRPVLNTEIFDKPPRGNSSTETAAHQDNFYFRAKEPGIALWIALDEMDADSGTVQYVKGSHRKGLRFHDWCCGSSGFAKAIDDFNDDDEELLTDVGRLVPGDVVVHHGMTIHCAGTNQTAGRRRGLVVNYVAEHIANSLADDLYQPALTFRVTASGHLVASVWKGWHDRHALAVTTLKCTLTSWCSADIAARTQIRVDNEAGELTVVLPDQSLMRRVVIAFVKSGHALRGVSAVNSLPMQLGDVHVPQLVQPMAPARVPDRYAGVWMLNRSQELALRLQSSSGCYVELCIPRTSKPGCDDGASDTERRSSTGMLLVLREDITMRQPDVAFQPATAMPDVMSVCWQGTDMRTLIEESLHGSGFHRREEWSRIDQPSEDSVTLELIDDEHGRRGVWMVIGTWFCRVIGRRSSDPLADVVCRSLAHAIKTYEEEWSIDPETATTDFEAAVGRAETPGLFKVLHDFTPLNEGSFILDNANRQLHRDAEADDVLVETWTKRRWKIRNSQNKLAVFGRLKRKLPDSLHHQAGA